MASNTDIVKKTILKHVLYYVYLVCMSVANMYIKIPITFYNARCRGSVLLWPHCNTSCTSGFVDDVMFSRNDK